MVTKTKKSASRKKNVKVLSLKKETVKNLGGSEAKRVKGGITPSNSNIIQTPTNTQPTRSAHTYIGVSGAKSTLNSSLNF